MHRFIAAYACSGRRGSCESSGTITRLFDLAYATLSICFVVLCRTSIWLRASRAGLEGRWAFTLKMPVLSQFDSVHLFKLKDINYLKSLEEDCKKVHYVPCMRVCDIQYSAFCMVWFHTYLKSKACVLICRTRWCLNSLLILFFPPSFTKKE